MLRKYSIGAALTVLCVGDPLWHDRRVIALLEVSRQLLADVLRFAIVALRPTRVVSAENLFLRRQLAMYVERGVKPRRPDVATRVSLALLSKLFDWRTSLVVVRPETLIRWHRTGFRLLWRFKSRPDGRQSRSNCAS